MNPQLKEGISKFFGGETPPPPTPIQTLALQHFVGSAKQPLNRKPGVEEERHQVLLGSETGSGKTLAYLLPLLHFLKKTDKPLVEQQEEISVVLPRSIILAPTHELARQLTQTAKQLSHDIKLRVRGMSSTASGNLDGGVVDVLVGTTRNLVRALERGYVKADKLEWVVVDEADVLLGESKGIRVAFEEDKGSST
jgi:ATP-dependent RNA helicase MRH4, mitochondrial